MNLYQTGPLKDRTIALLRLARAEGVGPITFRRLLHQYGSADAALDALPAHARAIGRANGVRIPETDEMEREMTAVARLGGRFLFLGQPDYPPLLTLLADAPPALAVLGDVSALCQRAVALVGGRNASANGQRMAEFLSASLAEAGLAVVSGLARGVDAAAHRGALRTGKTVAAVAGGLDVPYPPENADLQRVIADQGAVVSEVPIGTIPLARHFPRRNRIIAGLSLGVVVIEAAPRSGSLITAHLAQDLGREVFAVPGSPLDPRCQGSNGLIRDGAYLTETAADVLDNLPDHPNREGLARTPLFARPSTPGTSAAESADLWPDRWHTTPNGAEEAGLARDQLLDLLGPSPCSVDDLLRRCQLSAAAVMAALSDLELGGRVEQLPGNRVALI